MIQFSDPVKIIKQVEKAWESASTGGYNPFSLLISFRLLQFAIARGVAVQPIKPVSCPRLSAASYRESYWCLASAYLVTAIAGSGRGAKLNQCLERLPHKRVSHRPSSFPLTRVLCRYTDCCYTAALGPSSSRELTTAPFLFGCLALGRFSRSTC